MILSNPHMPHLWSIRHQLGQQGIDLIQALGGAQALHLVSAARGVPRVFFGMGKSSANVVFFNKYIYIVYIYILYIYTYILL